jgi:hypothetical protein
MLEDPIAGVVDGSWFDRVDWTGDNDWFDRDGVLEVAVGRSDVTMWLLLVMFIFRKVSVGTE